MRRSRAANRAGWRWPLMLLPLAATLAAGAAPPDQPGNPAAGHRLAQTWCSSCHVVDAAQATGTSTGAPSFSALARMSSTTPISLRVFLQTPHSRMPNLKLSRDEVDDVIAYILSLKKE